MTRIQFFFNREGSYAYLSHLDMLRLFIRALRRSGLPLDYSKGFNPHPRFTLALPLPVGVTASNEPAEVYFKSTLSPPEFESELNLQLPRGVSVSGSFIPEEGLPSPASVVAAAHYRAIHRGQADSVAPEKLRQELLKLLEKQDIEYIRANKNKRGQRSAINVRPFILKAEACQESAGITSIRFLLAAGSRGSVSPLFVLDQLAMNSCCQILKAENWLLHREGLYYLEGEQLKPFFKGK